MAFSDDEAGGFHGFACRHGICNPAVFHWYPDEVDPPKHVAASFRDWMVEAALPPGQSKDG